MSLPPPPPLAHHNPYNPQIQHQVKPVSPTLVVFLNMMNTSTHLLIGAVVFCAFSYANLANVFYRDALAAHIYLCVIGYILIMSQAILSFNTHAGWAYSLKYPEKRLVHGIMQIVGSVLAIIGSIIRIAAINRHFNTAHAVAGIIAMILTILNLIGGILNFVFPSKMNTAQVKIIHTCVGSLNIAVAFICLCLAFDFTYRYTFGHTNANLAIALTVFALVGVLISASHRTIQRIWKW